MSAPAISAQAPGLLAALADRLYRQPALLMLVLLAPPLLWLGVIYLGSLLALLAQSFFYIDEFSGQVVRKLSLRTYSELFTEPNMLVVARTVAMAAAVTCACALIAFPVAYFMVRYASFKLKALMYLGVMVPLWSSYIVRVYSWKLILAKEGVITWLSERSGTGWLLDAILATPVLGGPSLSFSMFGTFIVFVYIWLPFMILPIVAALERVPKSLIEASADLGATPVKTFVKVILPLAFPGVVAGSIFTFSLTLGDYIIPRVIGTSHPYIGTVVYAQQGVAGNVPLAAAFTVVPMVVMAIYLTIAKRLRAFDAL